MSDSSVNRAHSRINEMSTAVADMRDQLTAELAAADAAIANLNAVAATASSAINNSSVDRAAIHTQLAADEATTTALADTVTQLAGAVTTLAARVTTLENRKLTIHSGTAAIPLLTIGATTTVTITWPAPFPDTNYLVSDPVVSSSLIGKVTATLQGTPTTAGCTVKLTAGATVSPGSSVFIDAIRYA